MEAAGSGGIEDSVVGVTKDITKDILGSTTNGLDTTEAGTKSTR